MCGLVGIAGKLEFKDEAAMKRLLIFDTIRGLDATGLAAYNATDKSVKIAKIGSHPFDLFDTKRFTEALQGHKSWAFIGHNRSATVGKKNTLNAHPFEFGKIVGAHNGTLDKPSWDRLQEAIGFETEVDSAAIFAAIDKLGLEATIALMEEGSTGTAGAWALTWVNTEEGTLNFLRNKHRPLWYAYSEKFDKIFWASEWPMLDAALEMSNTPYDIYTTDKGNKFWQTKTDVLYTFDLADMVAHKQTPVRPEPHKGEYKGKEPAPVKTYGSAPFIGGTTNTTAFTKRGPASGIARSGNVLEFKGSASAPFGGHVLKEEFDKLAKYGCSYCGSDIDIQDIGLKLIPEQEIILCSDCSGITDQNRVYVDPVTFSETRRTALGHH